MCQACLRANVLACQLGLHANVPACLVRQKRSNFLYLRANVSTWFASVSRGMPTFQAFLLTKCYMEISILYYYEKFYIILDIINVMHMMVSGQLSPG